MASTNVAKFTGTLLTTTYPNKYNVVIPPEGPFFRTGLELKNSAGTKLIEGLDYYLGYYYKEAAVAMKDQIYGGIMLINGDTSVDYTISSIGREYRVPQTEIGKFLVKEDIADPRNVDWSELMRYAPVIPAIDPPANLDEALLRDEVVKALDDIRLGLIKRAGEMDAAYSEVTDLIFANGKKIFDDNLYSHHRIKNAHQYTTDEIGALKVLTKAVDSTKAFGKTLDELVAIMKTNGIQQAHIDTLMPVVLGELRGRLKVLNNGALTFRTADSSHVITLQGEKFLITTTRAINVTADADNNEKGVGVELGSGLNTAYVLNGAVAPIFNGAYLVTPDMVSLYLAEVKLLPGNAYFASTDSIKTFGTARESSPLTMNAQLPTATDTVPGLFAITNLSANLTSGTAISQYAVNVLKKTLDNYVDNTYTINGKKFVDDGSTQTLSLSASDVGVGNLNNTAPSEKPLTTAIRAVLANKALANHTHTFADLTAVPTASDTTAGLLQLWDAIDTTTDKVVTSKQGYNVQQRLNTYKGVLDTLLPSWTTGGASYGNSGFLNIPTVSNYAGFGFFRSSALGSAGIEGDKLYILRNGTDGPTETDGIYYWYSKVGNDGKLLGAVPTTQKYHPAGMVNFPGVTLTKVLLAGDGLALFTGSDSKTYLVVYGGSMNQAKHTQVYQVNLPDAARSTGSLNPVKNITYCTITLTAKAIMIAYNYLTNSTFYVAAWKVARTALTGQTVANFAVMSLTYPSKDGDAIHFVEDGGPEDDNTATKRIAYTTAAGREKWTGSRNVANYRPSFLSAARGENVRLRSESHGYYSNAYNATWSDAWATVYNIDVDTGKVTLETNIFPLAITENKLEFPNGQPPTSVSNRNFGVALLTNYFATAGYLVGIICDVYSNNPPYYDIGSLGGKEYYDLLAGSPRIGIISSMTGKGAEGSVYQQYMRMGIHLGGSEQKILFRYLATTKYAVAKYVTGSQYFDGYSAYGYGPDNDRVSVDAAVAQEIAMIPNVWKNNALTLNGRTINSPGTYAYKNVAGTTVLTADRITASQALFDSMNAAVQGEVAYYDNPLTVDKQIALQVFDIGGTNLAMMYLTTRTWENDSKVRAYNRTWVWRVPMAVDAVGNISLTLGSRALVVDAYYDNNAAISLTRDQYINSKLVYRNDGYVLLLGGVYRHGVVGDSRWASFLLTCDTSWSDWTNTFFRVNPQVGEQDLFIHPETGYLGITKWFYSGMYYGAALYPNLSRTFQSTTSEDAILAGVKTAEGWQLYVTEEEALRFGSSYYTLPEYSADIRTLFPGAYQNRTFYMHAVVTNGVAEYQLLTTKLPDTNSRLYLGTVVTDDKRILSSEFTKVKRLGELKQLTEHAETIYSHDVNVDTEARLSRLGLLRKQPIAAPSATGGTYLDVNQVGSIFSAQNHGAPIELLRDVDITTLPKDFKHFTVKGVNGAAQSAIDGAKWVGIEGMSAITSLIWTMIVEVTPSTPTVRVKVGAGYSFSSGSISVRNETTGNAASILSGNNSAVLTAQVGVKNVFTISGNSASKASMFAAFSLSNIDTDGTETPFYLSDADTVLIRATTNVSGPSNGRLTQGVREVYRVDMPAGISLSDYFPVIMAEYATVEPIMYLIEDNALYVGKGANYYGGTSAASKLSVNLMPKLL
ncbi:hypothetical protein pEaSNUABM6_00180 [Erwinia phage pEa_SNUABM_6]|nr:hypothetical protein pEaSNUABM6_00180 [Erwinia phage pEa_SNUABM_6]